MSDIVKVLTKLCDSYNEDIRLGHDFARSLEVIDVLKAAIKEIQNLRKELKSKKGGDQGMSGDEEAPVDQRMFRLDDSQWQAFQNVLDRPVRSKPHLTKLLAENKRQEGEE